jgi:probable phosphoglycerate mutase
MTEPAKNEKSAAHNAEHKEQNDVAHLFMTFRKDCFAAFEHDQAYLKLEEDARKNRRDVRILIIRHAQSAANLKPQEIGGRQNEAPLSKLGEEQAALLGARLKKLNYKFERVYCSTAQRAFQTASIATGEVGFAADKIVRSDAIQENSQGAWEGQDRRKIYTPEVMEEMNNNNWLTTPPGISPSDKCKGESQRDVEFRFLKFIEENILKPTEDGKDKVKKADDGALPVGQEFKQGGGMPTVAIFSHGVAIRCLLRGLLQSAPARTHKSLVDNTSITEFVYSTKPGGKGGWFLIRFNDVAHLEGTHAMQEEK